MLGESDNASKRSRCHFQNRLNKFSIFWKFLFCVVMCTQKKEKDTQKKREGE